MGEIEDYKKLVDLAREQRDEKSRLKGSLDIIISNLKNMGYSSLGKASIDLKKKQSLLAKKKKELSIKMENFRVKYDKFL